MRPIDYCYHWMEKETEQILQVIKEKNLTTIFCSKHTKANAVVINLSGFSESYVMHILSHFPDL